MSADTDIPLVPIRHDGQTSRSNTDNSEQNIKPNNLAIQPRWANTSQLTSTNFKDRISSIFAGNVGLALVCASQLFFALMNVTVKFFLETTEISVSALISVRMFITMVFCIAVMYFWDIPNPFLGPPEIRWQLFLRGFFGFGGLLCMYQSLKGLSVSDSVAIGYLSPSITVLLGVILLRESVEKRELITLGACLVGVTFVSRPPFLFGKEYEVVVPTGRLNLPGRLDDEITSEQRAVAVTWSFIGVFCSASAYIVIRFIGRNAHALHSMLYFSYLCCAVCVPITIFVPGEGYMPDSFRSLFLIILVGIFGFTGQTLLTMGLQREKAGRASLALYTSVVFALIIELIVFHTFPSFLSIIGVSIIVTAASWVAVGGSKKDPITTRPRPEDEESTPVSSSNPTFDSPTNLHNHHFDTIPPTPISDIPQSSHDSLDTKQSSIQLSPRPLRRTISASSSSSSISGIGMGDKRPLLNERISSGSKLNVPSDSTNRNTGSIMGPSSTSVINSSSTVSGSRNSGNMGRKRTTSATSLNLQSGFMRKQGQGRKQGDAPIIDLNEDEDQ